MYTIRIYVYTGDVYVYDVWDVCTNGSIDVKTFFNTWKNGNLFSRVCVHSVIGTSVRNAAIVYKDVCQT